MLGGLDEEHEEESARGSTNMATTDDEDFDPRL